MRKKLLVFGLATVMAVSLTACGGSGASKEETKKEVTYESILEDYSAKLKEAAPKLAEEFKEEADGVESVEDLADLSGKKVEDLAEICGDGVEEMAELQMKNNDEYETYEEWAGKLQDVYQDEAEVITDAYMESATK